MNHLVKVLGAPVSQSGGLVDFHCFGLVCGGCPEVSVHGLGLVRRCVPARGPGGRGAWLRRILEFGGGLGDVASEDVRGDGGPPRGYLGQFVSVLVVLARDVIELEAVEFVLEATPPSSGRDS